MDNYILWSLALFSIGMIIIVLEMFIPSGGLLGVLAAAALFASVGVAFSGSMWFGVTMLGAMVLAVPAMLVALVNIWPYTPIGRRVLIPPKLNPNETLPMDRGLRELEGRIGVTRTKMLPSGTIDVDGRIFDAISDGLPLEAGEPVRVVCIRSNRIMVRPATALEALEAAAPTTVSLTDETSSSRKSANQENAGDLLSRGLEELDLGGLEDGIE